MTERKDMQNLEELLQAIPPEAAGLDPGAVTPWSSAMKKILWGMGLLVFRLNLWYLPYLLPLVGGALLCLGARGLRHTNSGFAQVWRVSLIKLGWQVTFLVVSATRLGGHLEAGAAFWTVSALSCGLDFLLLWQLRRGIRGAFLDLTGIPPQDWLLPGLAAWLGTLALAVWGTLEPGAWGQRPSTGCCCGFSPGRGEPWRGGATRSSPPRSAAPTALCWPWSSWEPFF